MENVNLDSINDNELLNNSNIENIEPVEKSELSEEEYNIVIQHMLSDFLKATNQPSLEELILKAEGTAEVEGKLTPTHIKLVKALIRDHFASIGGNLDNLAAQRGITIEEGKLSSIEEETLELLISDYLKGLKNIKIENNI